MTGIFLTPDHKRLFEEVMTWLGKIYDGKFDAEYSAAVFILTADAITWDQAESYVSRTGIRFDDLLKEEDFSGGYKVLIKLAGNLFNGNQDVNPVEFMCLDNNNFKVALSAIMVRRFGIRVEDTRAMEVVLP